MTMNVVLNPELEQCILKPPNLSVGSIQNLKSKIE